MGADLAQLVPFGVPFDLMVYLSALPLTSLEFASADYPYAVLHGRRLPRHGHPVGVYNGWGRRGHELVLDMDPDLRAEPHYYGEGVRGMAIIVEYALRRPRFEKHRTRIYRAMGLHPTTGSNVDTWAKLERLGFRRLQAGLFVYKQLRHKEHA